MSLSPSLSEDLLLVQEDHEARFYAEYGRVAGEYDKGYLKRFEEDLNTTLLFVSTCARNFIEQLITRVLGRPVFLSRLRFRCSGRFPNSARRGSGD